ncbi:hypothetical protein FRC10_008051 [Ceratobasidium sp. 414]|nr:hypothetical protein FRC10_008051 [Ceratobasidium sp. 414]
MTSPQHSGGGRSHRHPLEIPELVHIVCGFLGEQDRVGLLYLSRCTYTAVLPIVWEKVDFKLALCLIPRMKVRRGQPDRLRSGYVFDFPNTTDLTRFNIHSRFIRTLRTSGPYIINFPGGWPSSDSETSSQPLLPNLERLVVNTFGTAEEDHVKWVPRLLHPGLLGFEMLSLDLSNAEGQYEEHSWLDQDTSFDLIDQISRTCPRIEALHIFPRGLAQSRADSCVAAYDNISKLQHLRSFTFSGTVVHEKLLQVLGQLPRLETLTLCADWAEIWEYDQSSLNVPDDSFVSLRHLYLYGLDESAMSRVCKASPLFRNLVTAVIIFDDQDFDENMSDTIRSVVAVMSLDRNSPHLQNLTIHPRGNSRPFITSWPVINAFKHMPLRRLNLGGTYFDSGTSSEEDERDEEDEDKGGENEDRDASTQSHPTEPKWEHLLSAVPQLEEFYIEQQQLLPGQLALFASHLPILRLLVFGHVRLEDEKLPFSNICVGTATQPVTLRAHSYFGSQQLPDEAISTAARCVVHFAEKFEGLLRIGLSSVYGLTQLARHVIPNPSLTSRQSAG